MMNTSTAPLAESEDFDNLSLRSKSSDGSVISIPISIPDKNNSVPPTPRKRPPPPPVTTTNNGHPIKRPFPVKAETFQNEEDNNSFFNPAFAIAFVYCCSAMSFLLGMNVQGLSLLRFPWIGNLLDYDYQDLKFFDGVIILQVMWCLHFVRRAAQVLFVNRYHGKVNCVSFMWMMLYHVIFGMWVGWSLNYHLSYRVPKAYFLVPGVMVFLIGEIGNSYCHWLMRNTRIQPSGILVPTSSGLRLNLPEGILFKYDNYPQFGFEVLSFIGFYLSSHTIAVGAFLVATIIYVVSLTLISHCQLKKSYTLINNNQHAWEK